MRARRGNFLLIFMVSFSVLMGISSLAIDGTRITSAHSQMQATADAAALAALTEYRETRDVDLAQDAAAEVAESNVVDNRVGAMEIEVRVGTWNRSADKSVGFATDADEFGAVSVTVRRADDEGVQSFVGNRRSDIAAHATASYRARDVVVVLDASPSMGESDGFDLINTPMNHARDALERAVEVLTELTIPEDRLSLYMYTGESLEIFPLSSVEEDSESMLTAVQGLDWCGTDFPEWLNYWRFMTVLTRQHNLWPLYAVDPWNPTGDAPGWSEPEMDGYAAEVAARMAIPVVDCAEARLVGQPEFEACVWLLSWQMFQLTPFVHLTDPIVGPMGEREVPTCNFGNVWSTLPPETAQDYSGFANEVVLGGVVQFPSTVLDNSYAWAGTNTAAGLRGAADELEANGEEDADWVVILVSDGKPSCETPTWDAAPNVADCDEQYRTDAFLMADRLEEMGASTWVIDVNLDDDAEQRDRMSQLVTGRGRYIEVADSELLPDYLEHIAKDVRVEIVR